MKTKRVIKQIDDIQQEKQKEAKNYIWKQFEQPPDVSNQAKIDAVLFIQNLIRGKYTQIIQENGKNRRIGLVDELRLAHILVQTRG